MCTVSIVGAHTYVTSTRTPALGQGFCTTPVVQNASVWLHEQPLPQPAAGKLHNNNNNNNHNHNNNITKVQVNDIVTYCVNK